MDDTATTGTQEATTVWERPDGGSIVTHRGVSPFAVHVLEVDAQHKRGLPSRTGALLRVLQALNEWDETSPQWAHVAATVGLAMELMEVDWWRARSAMEVAHTIVVFHEEREGTPAVA